MDALVSRQAQASYRGVPRSELGGTWSTTDPWDTRTDVGSLARSEGVEEHSDTAYPEGLSTSLFDNRPSSFSQDFELLPLVDPAKSKSKSPDVSVGETYLAANGADTNTLRGDHPVHDGVRPKMWTPFVLRRFTLIGAACVFAAILLALEILDLVANRNNGLSTTEDSKHYLWTYGPTAGKFPHECL
jgi:hypothetical protein